MENSTEAWLLKVFETVHDPEKSAGLQVSDWKQLCERLADLAPTTWYACQCGPISPLEGNIDALCPKCGQMRKLPPRRAIALWPLFVKSLCHILPDHWFAYLSRWMLESGLANLESAEKNVPYGTQKKVGVETECRRERLRYLRCIDGMLIYETGAVRNIQWIALPMPHDAPVF